MQIAVRKIFYHEIDQLNTFGATGKFYSFKSVSEEKNN